MSANGAHICRRSAQWDTDEALRYEKSNEHFRAETEG
jgi:hypothetical protein